MKRLLLTFALIFAFVCAQAADITSISNAFKAGNASSLSGAMDKVVDVALPSSSKKCNGSEAVSMLSSFFSSNKPSGFSVVHQHIADVINPASINHPLFVQRGSDGYPEERHNKPDAAQDKHARTHEIIGRLISL